MGKINFTNLSPGDSLTNTNINTTTQEFANQTATLQNENFRDQGLDIHNFKRGVLNKYSGVNNPSSIQQDEFDINKTIKAKNNGPHEEVIFLTTVSANYGPPLDLTPDANGFRDYSIITRFGFHCFIDWFGGTLSSNLGGLMKQFMGAAYLRLRCVNADGDLDIKDHVNEMNVFYLVEKSKMIRFGRASYPTQTAFDITEHIGNMFPLGTQKITDLHVDLYFKFTQDVDKALVDEFTLIIEGNLQVVVLGT